MIKSAKQKGLRKNVKRHAYNCPCNRKKDIKNARGRGGSFVKYTSKRSTECPGPPRKPGQWRKCTGSNTPADCPSNFRSESVDARDCSTGDVTCTLCVRTCKCQSTGGCPVRFQKPPVLRLYHLQGRTTRIPPGQMPKVLRSLKSAYHRYLKWRAPVLEKVARKCEANKVKVQRPPNVDTSHLRTPKGHIQGLEKDVWGRGGLRKLIVDELSKAFKDRIEKYCPLKFYWCDGGKGTCKLKGKCKCNYGPCKSFDNKGGYQGHRKRLTEAMATDNRIKIFPVDRHIRSPKLSNDAWQQKVDKFFGEKAAYNLCDDTPKLPSKFRDVNPGRKAKRGKGRKNNLPTADTDHCLVRAFRVIVGCCYMATVYLKITKWDEKCSMKPNRQYEVVTAFSWTHFSSDERKKCVELASATQSSKSKPNDQSKSCGQANLCGKSTDATHLEVDGIIRKALMKYRFKVAQGILKKTVFKSP